MGLFIGVQGCNRTHLSGAAWLAAVLVSHAGGKRHGCEQLQGKTPVHALLLFTNKITPRDTLWHEGDEKEAGAAKRKINSPSPTHKLAPCAFFLTTQRALTVDLGRTAPAQAPWCEES